MVTTHASGTRTPGNGQLGYPVPRPPRAGSARSQGPSQHGGHPGSDSPLPSQRRVPAPAPPLPRGGEHVGDDRARPHCTTDGEQDRGMSRPGRHRGGPRAPPIDHGDQTRSRSDGQHEAHRVGQPRVQASAGTAAHLQDMGRGASPPTSPAAESIRPSQMPSTLGCDPTPTTNVPSTARRRRAAWRCRGTMQPPSQPVPGEQDRAVRARHRREVGQARCPHVICGDRRESLITAEVIPDEANPHPPFPRHLPHQHTRGGGRGPCAGTTCAGPTTRSDALRPQPNGGPCHHARDEGGPHRCRKVPVAGQADPGFVGACGVRPSADRPRPAPRPRADGRAGQLHGHLIALAINQPCAIHTGGMSAPSSTPPQRAAAHAIIHQRRTTTAPARPTTGHRPETPNRHRPTDPQDAGQPPAPTVTGGCICANVTSDPPRPPSSSSTAQNPPFCSRYVTIRAAMTRSYPGISCRSSSEAELMSTGPPAGIPPTNRARLGAQWEGPDRSRSARRRRAQLPGSDRWCPRPVSPHLPPPPRPAPASPPEGDDRRSQAPSRPPPDDPHRSGLSPR